MTSSEVTPPSQRSWPRRLLNRLEVDRAVFYAVVSRGWQLVAGPVTLVLIANFFSREVQGYYYTFWSLIALQTFFELAFHVVIINLASHEWERLELDDRRGIQGDETALSRLSSLFQLSLAWYGVAAILFFLAVGAAGLHFFSFGESSGKISWQMPWLSLTAASAATFAMSPFLFVLEGCNQVRNVYKFQFCRAVAGNIVVWTAIVSGAQLWTVALVSLVRLLAEVLLVLVYRRFFGALFAKPRSATIDWKTEVWPFQWRVGLKGLVSYFNHYLINPLIFYYQGEVAAGQVGMTWQVLSSLQAAALAWVQTRAARFGMLVSRKDYQELDRIFFRLTTIATVMMSLAGVAFVGFDIALYAFGSTYAGRLTSPMETAALTLAMTLSVVQACQWTYIHAHQRSPHMGLTVCLSLLNGGLLWWGAWQFGVTGVCFAYLTMMALLYVPIWTYVWFRFRREWRLVDEPEGQR